jgi:hypothetical protein
MALPCPGSLDTERQGSLSLDNKEAPPIVPTCLVILIPHPHALTRARAQAQVRAPLHVCMSRQPDHVPWNVLRSAPANNAPRSLRCPLDKTGRKSYCQDIEATEPEPTRRYAPGMESATMAAHVTYWGAFPSYERASLALPRLIALYGGQPSEWRISRAPGERSWHVYRHTAAR